MIKVVIFSKKVVCEESIHPDIDSMMDALKEKGVKTEVTGDVEKALAELDVKAEECLYVGESLDDLKNAGELGIHPVQAMWNSEEGQDSLQGFRHADKPMDIPICVDEGDSIFYASWYPMIEKGDFISGPTYECGHYFNLFHEGSFEYDGVKLKYY